MKLGQLHKQEPRRGQRRVRLRLNLGKNAVMNPLECDMQDADIGDRDARIMRRHGGLSFRNLETSCWWSGVRRTGARRTIGARRPRTKDRTNQSRSAATANGW